MTGADREGAVITGALPDILSAAAVGASTGFKTCRACGVAYPLRVAWDIALCWACGQMIWRGVVLSATGRLARWRWRLALRLYFLARCLIRTPEDARYS